MTMATSHNDPTEKCGAKIRFVGDGTETVCILPRNHGGKHSGNRPPPVVPEG